MWTPHNCHVWHVRYLHGPLAAGTSSLHANNCGSGCSHVWTHNETPDCEQGAEWRWVHSYMVCCCAAHTELWPYFFLSFVLACVSSCSSPLPTVSADKHVRLQRRDALVSSTRVLSFLLCSPLVSKEQEQADKEPCSSAPVRRGTGG